MKQRRGSAIIIAMLLISAIGGIAFSFARMVFLETATASLYENGAVAYYAAESGLEEGFLRYRYDRNAEVPTNAWKLNDNKVFRNNLAVNSTNTGILSGGIIPNNILVTDKTKQFYDLRMGYLGTFDTASNPYLPFLGQDTTHSAGLDWNDLNQSSYGTGVFDFLHISKDNSYKIVLNNVKFDDALPLDLYVKYNAPLSDQCHALMEIKFSVKTTGSDVKEYKELLSLAGCASNLGFDERKLLLGNLYSATANTLIIGTDLKSVLTKSGAGLPIGGSEITLSLKPLYYDAYFGIKSEGCLMYNCTDIGHTLTGPNTYITTSGYYGGVVKKLSANIDRQSGSLYDLYDYVIYKAN